MLHLITKSMQQFLDDLGVEKLKEVLLEVNDANRWQEFIQDTQSRVEQTLFRKEFRTDACNMPESVLQNVCEKGSSEVAQMAAQELRERSRRKGVREAVIATLHDPAFAHGYVLDPLFLHYTGWINKLVDFGSWPRWYMIGEEPVPCPSAGDYIGDAEVADIKRFEDLAYVLAFKYNFGNWFDRAEEHQRIHVYYNILPDVIANLIEKDHVVGKEAACDILRRFAGFFESLEAHPHRGVTQYAVAAVVALLFAKTYPDMFPMSRADILGLFQKQLDALRSRVAEFASNGPYAYSMLLVVSNIRNKQKFFKQVDMVVLEDMIQQSVYEFIAAHPDPSDIFMLRYDNHILEDRNGKIDVYYDVTHEGLKEVMGRRC